MAHVLDKRLLFVTGKGGVGKSTVAAALGLLAARRGKRVILCELAQQERASRIFRGDGIGFEETELAPNLAGISIDPQRAMEEYLRTQVGNRALFRLLFENRIFQYFTAAAPGVREIVSIGKVWELAQLERPWTKKSSRYDLVVVDAPATGHGLGILRAPRTMRDIARVGPIRRQADRIDSFIRDSRQTGIVTVALPEEMPVTETIEFRVRLLDEMKMAVDAFVINGLYPERFSGKEARAMTSAEATSGSDGSLARPAMRAALAEHHRARTQRSQVRRLRKEVDGAVTLPYLFEPELGLAEVERLSHELERRL
ncbi:MAG: ArsA family ATPase [Thermoleophilaceae bacterium]|nr:ArsA family ATPase [Thermoleophilaceae bacterium]